MYKNDLEIDQETGKWTTDEQYTLVTSVGDPRYERGMYWMDYTGKKKYKTVELLGSTFSPEVRWSVLYEIVIQVEAVYR